MKISILITNYNKLRYLKRSLPCVINQKYNNYEIILFDDHSTDRSVKFIKNFKKIKLIKNKQKKIQSAPLLNQFNGIIKSFNCSKGEIICLMDADDFFSKNKLLNINRYFSQNKSKKFLVNMHSSITFKDVSNSMKNFVTRWPHIYPTSCISFRRNFFKKFLRYSRYKDFKNLGIDARLIIFAKYFCNDYNKINKKLNNYTISKTGNYSKYGHLGKNWWISRNEAFEYLKYILKLRNIRFKKISDYYLTKIINFFVG